MILNGLEREGIDISHMRRLADRRNGLYFIENDDDGECVFHFWREESAATRTLRDGDIDSIVAYASSAEFLAVSGVALAVMGDVDRMVYLISTVKNAGTKIVLDANYRESLWKSPPDYQQGIERLLPHTSIFLPSMSDIRNGWMERNPVDLCGEWSSYGVETIVIKNGASGVLHFDNGLLSSIPPLPDIVVVDTTGAGDAFNAGFISASIDGASIPDAIDMGQRTAARALGVRGAIPGNVENR